MLVETSPAEASVMRRGSGLAAMAAVPVCLGLTAVITQVVLLRELVVIFGGNEVTLGLVLAIWLLWTAFGGGILGRLRLPVSPRVLTGWLQVAVGVSVPASVLVGRLASRYARATPGELLGPGAMLVTAVVSLAVFCALSGWLFAAASRFYAESGAPAAEASGAVYLLEAAGSCAGGLLASVVLLRYCTALQIAVVVLAANLLSAVCLLVRGGGKRAVTMMAAAAILIPAFAWLAPAWEARSLASLWPGFRLVLSATSVYGRLDVLDSGTTRSVYENGVAAFHAEDPTSAEEAVHFGLLQHRAPRSLLLIGGGLSGGLGQALQHRSLDRIDYVELDPTVITLARRYFPAHAVSLDSPRVSVHNLDGRLFVKTTRSRFDVIIVNLPDPQTAQLNRFYTREFFAEAARALNPGGLLSLRVRGAEDYISPELGDFLRCLNQTLRSVFADVVTIPGDNIHFAATNGPGVLDASAETLLGRLRQRQIETRYVREYYLPFRLSPDRVRQVQAELQSPGAVSINTDLSPRAYYFAVTLWSTHFSDNYRRVFSWLAGIEFPRLLLAMAAPVLAASLAVRRCRNRRGRRKASAGLYVAATGMALMALEVLLLLGFQAIYGYVYYQLAIIIGAMMAGMAAGSRLVLRSRAKLKPGVAKAPDRTLAGLQAAVAISPLLAYAVLRMLTTAAASSMLLPASATLFPVLAMASGILGGYQFQVASFAYFAEGEEARGSLAALYAVDLVGAFLGSILVSAYSIPVFGMGKSAWLISALVAGPILATLPARAGSAGAAR